MSDLKMQMKRVARPSGRGESKCIDLNIWREDLMNNVKVTILFYLVVASLVLMFCSSSDNKELVGEYVFRYYCYEDESGILHTESAHAASSIKIKMLSDGNYIFEMPELKLTLPQIPTKSLDENESGGRDPLQNKENVKENGDEPKIITTEDTWEGKYSIKGNTITFTNFHQEERDISTWEFTLKTEEAEEDTFLIILPKKYVLDGDSKDVSGDIGYVFQKL
jgi:hypothetical protein